MVCTAAANAQECPQVSASGPSIDSEVPTLEGALVYHNVNIEWMRFDYVPGDHPISFRVSSGGKELQPWQAYASYSLTGLSVLYGHCSEGFAVDKVFGTHEAKPMHFDSESH